MWWFCYLLHIYSWVWTKCKEQFSPNLDYWLKDLGLFSRDHTHIFNNEWLTGNVIDAAQTLLKIGGLQPIVLG